MPKVVNRELARGVNRYSSNQMAKLKGRYLHTKKKTERKANTGKPEHTGKWYPAEDERRPLRRRFTPTAAKLRSTITPGTVLILLAGRFRGKRVVFLKQLASGLLLVSGPYKVNGVPLRRVNQAYVIATSTNVDLSGVTVPAHINDAYFAREKKAAPATGEERFFQQEPQPAVVSDQRKADQKSVDAALLSNIKKVDFLRAYLNARFSLSKGDRPHEMAF